MFESSKRGLTDNDSASKPVALENPPSLQTLRRMDVVAGTLTLQRKIISCLVIGENWPAWLSTARALAGAENVAAMAGLPAGVCCTLDATSVDWGLERAKEEASTRWGASDVVFISGQPKFVQLWVRRGMNMRKALVTLDRSKRKVHRIEQLAPEVDWKQEGHYDCGGATSSHAWVGVGRGLESEPDELLEGKARRGLADYVNPVVMGLPFAVTDTQRQAARGARSGKVCWSEEGLLEGQGLLPVDKPGALVLAACVFSKTGWTKRRLNADELGQLWDLPVKWKGAFEARSLEELPFLDATPGKILWAVAAKLKIFGVRSEGVQSTAARAGVGFGWVDQDEQAKVDKILELVVKDDDAEVNVELWNDYALRRSGVKRTPEADKALDGLRDLMLERWFRNLNQSFLKYLREKHGPEWWRVRTDELDRDLAAGAEAIARSDLASWWEWTDGSTLYFWRWPSFARRDARDGSVVRVAGKLPNYRARQRKPKDPTVFDKVKRKVKKVVDRRYITAGSVKSLTGYFDVPKGLNDIRMVYDATKSGLNSKVWAPSFAMPTIDSALDHVCCDTFSGDADLGEFFLNFPLDPLLRPYAGIDLSPLELEDPKRKEKGLQDWKRWSRMLMGFKPSPYITIRLRLLVEDVVRGDHRDPSNPYHWEAVVLNLPGSAVYDPTMPWVYRVRYEDGKPVMASDHVTFVDDVRGMGSGEEACWKVTSRVAKVLQFFGVQDAARKRRGPSQAAGAWAGSVIRIVEAGVGVTVSEDKWQRAKEAIRRWLKDVQQRADALDRKELESDRGFLIYVARTFPVMKSYLKGFSLTLESWRPDRDEDGWKVDEDVLVDRDGHVLNKESNPAAPKHVKAVPRFLDDLKALEELTESDHPPLRIVRPRWRVVARYGFGDASGSGFGAASTTAKGVRVRYGVWGSDESFKSSNNRELRNLVEALEDLWEKGELYGVEIFIITDNSTTEGCFYHGTSTSKELFELVLRLKKLEMAAGAKVHLIHCAGTRQIAQGCDGLSRGDLTEGIMAGQDMLSFVPLHLGAFDSVSAPDLLHWIRQWTDCRDLEPLAPAEWFTLGQDIVGGNAGPGGLWFPEYRPGVRLWAPPPAAARVAVERLREARHKHQRSTHVFVCPRIMCYDWRKQLLKEADMVFYMPAGHSPMWPSTMHEPLLIAVCLPFIRCHPWKLRRTPRLLAMERDVHRMFKEHGSDPGIVLRKLCKLPGRLDAMSPELVQQVLFYRK